MDTERIVYLSNKIENLKDFIRALNDPTNVFLLKVERPISEEAIVEQEVKLSKRLKQAILTDLEANLSEEKDKLENQIKAKLTGSPNAMSFVISFNGRDAEITVVPFPVNDAQHKQWEYLTGESRQQIMTGHKVVSPKLFGIMSDGGLGNNANELDEAEAQLMKRVIQPKQRYITEALEEVLNFYNIILDLYFVPLTEQKNVQMHSHDEKKKIDLDLYGYVNIKNIIVAK